MSKGAPTLIVLAHPLNSSLCAHLAGIAADAVDGPSQLRDLYAEAYAPCLTHSERAQYYETAFDDTAGLQDCTRLVLVFPTWWSGLPAILKGWIDRSFLPGVAYDHDPDLKALRGRLTGLREVIVITTCGGPWWVDWLVLRRPVRRALKWGVFKPCAPKARFRMLSLYGAEAVSADKVRTFKRKIIHTVRSMR